LKRFISAIIIAALGLSALTACSSSAGVNVVKNSIINIAQIGELYSINTDVTPLAGEQNASELANLTTSSFYDIDATGNLVANTKLGTVKVLSKSPLKVRYSLADGAKWSDGTAIDAADLALSLASGSNLAGVDFSSVRNHAGISYASLSAPAEAGSGSITVQFVHPVADFQNALRLSVAAHVVARLTGKAGSGVSDQKKYVLDAVNNKDAAALKLLANAYATGFGVKTNLRVQPQNPILVSSGAYRLEKVTSSSDLTLVANNNFQTGMPTKVERVHLVYFVDATAAVAGMSTGGVDISTADDSGLASLSNIQQLADSIKTVKIKTTVASGATSEQVLFNFAPGSIFASGTTSNSAARALKLRQAFLNLVPKTRVLQAISERYNASSSDSFVFNSHSDFYQSAILDNGSSNYLIQDVEKAGEIMKSLGISLPLTVRVVFDTGNPRAQAEWQLLQERASGAGFTLQTVSSTHPSLTIESGAYDVFIGPRPLIAAPGGDVFSVTNGSFNGFSSSAIDAILAKYASAKPGLAQDEQLKNIDVELFTEAFGMPLYEVPSLLLFTSRVGGFVASPNGNSATWGYYNWSIKASSTK
jgi:peptide/nickel transport system substrate-binding protein